MNRNEALELLKQHLKNKNLVKHCLAVEACMRAMAKRLGHDPEPWGLAGILHDLDYEATEKSPELHTSETVKILKEKAIAPEVIHAVQAHAGKATCESPMDWAIYSIDPLTGLIIAATLMHPDKKLKSVDLEFVERSRSAATWGLSLASLSLYAWRPCRASTPTWGCSPPSARAIATGQP